MNILQIHNFYRNRGGESLVFSNEYELLRKKDHNVYQLTADNSKINSFFKIRKRFYKQLYGLLEKEQFDVAHVHNVFHIIGTKVYKILSKYNIPIVQTLHNFRFLCPNGLFLDSDNKICELCKEDDFKYSVRKKCYHNSLMKSLLMAKKVKRLRREGINYIAGYIALTEFAKAKFISGGIPEEKIFIKPNFLPDIDLPLISDGGYGLYLGRISKEKGISNVIKAFSRIDFNLKIAGVGKYTKKAKKEAEYSENIEFLGFVSGIEKSKLLAAASFIIIPSECYEMFGLSIIEGYKNSKPAIATDLGGMKEIVRDGKTGLLFKNNDLDNLREKIIRMINHKSYLEMGKNARKLFEEKYTEEVNYKELVAIYKKTIKEKL